MSKTTKLSSSKLLSISKQRKNVDEPLRNRTYLGKELYLNFFGCRFSLTHGHRHEKQVVLGPIIFKAPQSGDKKQVYFLDTGRYYCLLRYYLLKYCCHIVMSGSTHPCSLIGDFV